MTRQQGMLSIRSAVIMRQGFRLLEMSAPRRTPSINTVVCRTYIIVQRCNIRTQAGHLGLASQAGFLLVGSSQHVKLALAVPGLSTKLGPHPTVQVAPTAVLAHTVRSYLMRSAAGTPDVGGNVHPAAPDETTVTDPVSYI
jgi:hypothetical protein